MRFLKNDYLERQKKIRKVMLFGLILAFAIGFIWYSFDRKWREDVELTKILDSMNIDLIVQSTDTHPHSNSRNKDLPTLVKEAAPSIVAIITYNRDGNILGQGSGFFINTKGDTISNRHVFWNARRADVKINSITYPVDKVLADDPKNDLILFSIKTDPGKFAALPLALKVPQVGEKAVVIGNPLGLETTVSDGIVSAQRKLENGLEVLQVTSPISPGSSGSPVLNIKGEVIGVATFIVQGGQNLNFAIPVTFVKKLIPLGIGKGKIEDISFADSEYQKQGDAYSRGLMYYNAKEYNLAIPEFQKAISKEPDNHELYFYLGMCYKEEQPTSAIDAFKKTIELNPEYVLAYVNLGSTYIKMNMYQKAAEILREAIRLDPNFSEAFLNLGMAYVMAKEYRAAVKILEKAANMGMDAKGYYILGFSYVELKMFSEGIKALETSVELDPDLLESHLILGFAYARVKNWTKGLETLNRALILDPQNPKVRFLMGIVYLGLKNVLEAERQYEILKEIKGEDTPALCSDLESEISRYKNNRSNW
jgi:tetratricopeptide (TPR) repeat protein